MGIGNKSRHLNTKLAQLKTKIKGLPFVCDLDYKVIAMQQIWHKFLWLKSICHRNKQDNNNKTEEKSTKNKQNNHI